MNSNQIEDVYYTNGYASGPGQVWVVIDGQSYKIRAKDLLRILQGSSVDLKITQAKVYQYVEVV